MRDGFISSVRRSHQRPTSPRYGKPFLLLGAMLVANPIGCGLAGPDPVELPAPSASYQCQRVDGIQGAEDITVDHATGFAYVSATNRRVVLNGHDLSPNESRVGFIYRLDLRREPVEKVDVTPDLLRRNRFAPHGISLLERPGYPSLLFVINHRNAREVGSLSWVDAPDGHVIEVLSINPDPSVQRLAWSDTIAHPMLVSPNDIAAIGERAFYVTNEHGSRPGMRSSYLDITGQNDGFLAFYSDGHMTRVSDVPWANGVQVDRRISRLYVASSSHGTVGMFGLLSDGSPATRQPLSTLRLGTGVDNIEVDRETGDLLIAAHPDRFKVVQHRYSFLGEGPAPSQVIRVSRDTDGTPRSGRRILERSGDEARVDDIAAASVATSFRRLDGTELLVIGSIFSPFVLVCSRTPGGSTSLRGSTPALAASGPSPAKRRTAE